MLKKSFPPIFVPLLCLILLFLFLSVFYSEEPAEDSYQHFQTSVEVLKNRDWEMLITDTWNKPFPATLYGIAGQWGLVPARLVSVLLTLITGILTYKLAALFLSPRIKEHPWTFVGFFICQLAVLPQTYLTMTELTAAFLLASGLFLYYTHHPLAAFFVLGWLPLARMEASLMMAWFFVIFSLEHLLKQEWHKKGWGEVICWNAGGALPFLCWWGAGIFYTDSEFWFLQSSYSPYLRPFDLTDILKVNTLTALPGVLSAPALFLFLLGCFHLPALLSSQSGKTRWFQGGLYGILAIHGFFLSSFVVYPKGNRFGDLAIAAINPRNFNVISPIIALFLFAGAVSLIEFVKQPQKPSSIRKWAMPLLLTEAALIGFYFFQQALGAGFSKGLFKLGLHHLLLLVFCGWIVRNFRKQSTSPFNGAAIRLTTIAGFLIGSFFLSVPLFWHPLSFYDQQTLVQKELCSWLQQNQTNPQRLILQDINSRLDRFCRIPSLNAPWAWPHTFRQTALSAPIGSWVLIETDQHNHPRSRYPANLLQSLQDSSSFTLIKKSKGIPLTQPWESWLNRISSRNLPTRWQVYEKRGSSE